MSPLTTALWTALIETPWWVYLLLVYLLFIGLRARRARVVALKKLMVMPILFSVLSLHTLLTSVDLAVTTVGAWAIALLVGAGLGFWQIIRQPLQCDRQHGLIACPGSWSVLLLIVLIFGSKYYFSYELSVHPSVAQHPAFVFSLLGVSGLCTGLFIGRFACYCYRMLTLPSVDLTGKINYKLAER